MAATLRPLDEALATLVAAAPAAPEAQEGPLDAALGRVLAADIAARIDVPPADNSAMDGYAVRAGDAGRELRCSQRIPAGTAAAPLAADSVARIFTGAPVPAGADAVVMQEDAAEGPAGVRLPPAIGAGQHIRRRGEDTRAGDLLLPAGRRLRPQDLGLLASQGVDRVPLRRPLAVGLLSTGSELREAGSGPLAPGQIYNSNRPMLLALLSSLGCVPRDFGCVPDSAARTRECLREAAAQCDLIISSGGVSVGEADQVRDQVAALGAIDLWRVAIKPGKPFAFGQVLGTPFLGLPGNPASAFVTFLLLARPWILVAQGRRDSDPRYLPGRADFSLTRANSRCEFLRASLRRDGQALWATAYGNQSSGILRSIVASDCLLRVPAATTLAPGDAVDLLLLDQLLL